MNLRRFGGYALCVSALISLSLSLWYNLGGDNSTLVTVAALLGGTLFIVGLPAIQSMQPQTGRLGQVGLALMALGSLTAMGVYLYSTISGSDTGEAAPFASALLALAGDLLVGWLTIGGREFAAQNAPRSPERVFPAWVGWLLIAGGVLNFAGGLMPAGDLATAVGVISAIAMPAALIGFGLLIVRSQEAAVVDGRSRV